MPTKQDFKAKKGNASATSKIKNAFTKTDTAARKSFKIITIYFLFGSAWIILSDLISNFIFIETILQANIIKGLFFVLSTSVLIYSLIYPALKKVLTIQKELQQANLELEEINMHLQKEKSKLIESEQKLNESVTLFRAVFDQATIGIAIAHNDTFKVNQFDNIPSINAMFEKITGRTQEELEKTPWTDITHPDDLLADLENFNKFKTGETDGYCMEKRYIKPDGSFAWINMTISPLRIGDSWNNYNLCIIEDISKRKELQKVLFDSERSKAVLLDNLPGMAYKCNFDREWTMQFVSAGCFELTGYKAESLLYNKEKSFNDLISIKYQEYLWGKWQLVLQDKTKLKEEYELITATGEVKWVFEQGQGVFDEKGNVIALEGLIIDITDRKMQEMKLKYITNHDALTGLYNRRFFEETISNDLNISTDEKRAVLLLNLRKFNLLNLTFGYAYSEKIIKELSQKLCYICSHKTKLFHISIDRFVLYVKDYQHTNELVNLCNSIIEMLSSYFASKTLGGNIGVLEIDNAKCNAESVLKNVSIAAGNVSENQIFGYIFFDKQMEDKLIRETEIKNELTKAALDKNDESLYLLYQPIVNLSSNSISGFEALARFKSEKLGNISPIEFIPIAEQTQLIVPLGKKIMRMASQFLKELQVSGYDTVTMSFNVSSVQLLRDDFLPDLIEIIYETGVSPHKLIIEITESIFSNNYSEINERLEKIKELGIKIAIDDFGTGYSSLSREEELNVNCLKIDKYFIDKLAIIDVNQAITGDIISMAHKLGHYVVAEGVEHENQKQYLINHGCDFMQGYLFSKPVAKNIAVDILNKQS